MKNLKKAFLLALLFLVVPIMSACNQDKREVSISVISSSYRDGTVLGGGVYKEDENATLIANPSTGKAFVAWIKNNKIISEESSFSFKVKISDGGTYTAVFKSENPTYLNPLAIAFRSKSLKPEQNLTIQSLSFNFAIGESTQSFNIGTYSELEFGVYENEQTSSIYDFDSEYLLRLRSSYGEETYTFSTSISYTLGETIITRNTSKVLTLVNLEEKTDIMDTIYYQATLTIKDANIETTVYIWLTPAGVELLSSDIVI